MEETAEAKCLRLAARQHGAVSYAQLRESGLSKSAIWRRTRSSTWTETLPGVYIVQGTPPTWPQRQMAACLWGGEAAVASHRAAAALFDLDGFAQDAVEICGTTKTRAPLRSITVHRSTAPAWHTTTKLGIPTTKLPRTLLDLGALGGTERLERAVDDALRRGLTSTDQLRRTLAQWEGHGRRGAGVLRELLEQRVPGYVPSASDFQARVRKLLAATGLPPMIEEYEVWDEGTFIARVDFAYPDVLLAVEADGYWCHSGRLDWQHDRTRRNALTRLRWRVLHVTWEDLKRRPEEIVDDVKASLCTGSRIPRPDAQRTSG